MALGTFAGSAWIGVKPNFSGFNKATEKGATAGGRAGGKAMGKAFGEQAEASTKVATRKLSSAVGTARNAEATAAGKVRIAEQRLAETRSNGRAKASQLAAAEESLAKANRDLSTAQGRTRTATDALQAAQKRNAATVVDADKKQSRFAAGASKARGRISSLAGSLKNAAKQYGALAGAAVITGGGALAGASIKAASDAQQSLGATETVFKRAAGTIVKYSDRAAMKYGLSANQYRESANLIGSLFKNQGVATDQLAGKTDKMISQASDLAATFGGTTSDAVGALSSAFKGEFDPLEAYGISLKQSTVNSEAMRLANVKSKKDWDALSLAQQKTATQQATTNLIMAQSKDATGAFAKEADTLAGQQQRLGAAWEDGKVTLGRGLLPVLTTGLTKLTGFVQGMREGTGAGGQFRNAILQGKETVEAAVSFVVRYKNQLAVLAVGIGAVVLAQKAYVVATTLAELWTKRQAIAQALLNRAMMLNPVGIVVAALTALGVGLVVLYKKHEGFRNVVNRVWASVKKAALSVVSWFRSTAWPWMRTVLTSIGNAATWLWKNAFGPALRGIGKVVSWWYNNIVKRYFSLVGTVLRGAGRVGMWLWRNALAPAFRGIGAVISWLWSHAVRPTFARIGSTFRTTAAVAKWLWRNGIRPSFESIADKTKWLWNKAKDSFDRLKSGVRAVKDAFSTAKDGIAKAWNGLSGAVSKPIRTALGWVNDHFIGPINKMLSKVGAGFSIPKINIGSAKAKGYTEQTVRQRSGDAKYAAGGRVRGYSPTPTSDNIPAWLTAGEFVLPVRATRALAKQVGHTGLEQLRRGALPAFAKGGMVYQQMASWLKKSVPGAVITSTNGGGHAKNSYHYQNKAIDIGGPPDIMRAAAAAIQKAFGSNILELIHNPGYSVKNGKKVAPSFWGGSTWAGHANHVHWAMNALTGGSALGGGFLTGLAKKVLDKGKGALDALLDKAPKGLWSQALVGVGRKMTQSIYDKLMPSLEVTGDMSAPGGGVERWRSLVVKALGMVGQPVSLANVTLRRMMQESGGNPRAVNNWDINARRGDPSKGLMQVIGSTFRAYAMRGHDRDVYDPLSNILASMRYALSRYGSLATAYNRAGGYARGTTSATPGPHWVGEEGPELLWFRGGERVASASRSREIVKDQWAGRPVIVQVVDRDGQLMRFVDGRIDMAADDAARLSRRGS